MLPAFAAAYAILYPPDKTWEGKARQRQGGGGAEDEGQEVHCGKVAPGADDAARRRARSPRRARFPIRGAR
jgi:hypothetical protein